MIGRLSARCSRLRLSCEPATSGQLNSLAMAFNVLEISDISTALFSGVPDTCMSCI